jgi:hypothetical protein
MRGAATLHLSEAAAIDYQHGQVKNGACRARLYMGRKAMGAED